VRKEKYIVDQRGGEEEEDPDTFRINISAPINFYFSQAFLHHINKSKKEEEFLDAWLSCLSSKTDNFRRMCMLLGVA
jgi:hypothetical protein